MTTTITTEAGAIEAQISTVGEHATAIAIVDDETFQRAATCLRRIKALHDAIADLFTPHIARAYDAHRALVADRRRLERPLVDAERILKAKLARFSEEEERRRAVAARRDTAAATEARTVAMWQEVEALERDGYHEEAAALSTELVRTPMAPVITAAPVHAAGLATREVWKYEVVDPHQVPLEYWMLDHKKLGAVVRALKSSVAIPGVRVWAERTITMQGRE